MRLTTKGRYAIRALLDIALHEKEGAISLADISVRQKISQSYLEQLFAKLRRKNLVKSVRGPGGGYLIHRDMSQVTIADILNAIDEGSLDATSCASEKNCQHGEPCLTHELWCDLTKVIFDYLNGVTLAQVLEKIKARKRQV